MKFISCAALLASLTALGVSSAGCSQPDATQLSNQPLSSEAAPNSSGSLRLSLSAGDVSVTDATAVLSGGADFPPQTHDINVSDDDGVASVFFGGLPAGSEYSIRLIAGDCTGLSTFAIRPGQLTVVNVALTCPGAIATDAGTGSVLITGTFPDAGVPNADAGTPNPACDHILEFAAAPTIQNGSAPSTVALVLRDGVTPSAISWMSASTNGATGTIGDQDGPVDTLVSFDCTTNGVAYVIANVTASGPNGVCTEQGRVAIACLNQSAPPGPSCGDGIINQDTEECDGSAFPADAGAAGSICSATCQIVPPAAPTCGDGIINQDTEECDGSAFPADSGAPGAVCSTTCKLIVPTPPMCGDGIINQSTEQCDGSALPSDAVPGSTCRADCTLAAPVTLGTCGKCSAEACATERAAVDAKGGAAAVMECVLGEDWPNGERAPASSCGNLDLLTCYCGDVPGPQCATKAPGDLTGACVQQILTGTGCDSSSCVASAFLSEVNATGIAMQYLQCQQTNCYDDCFNP